MDAIRVLVAEDDAATRKCLLALLERDADVEVIDVCVTAAQTAAALQRTSPDLLFLNVAMPGMSGFDILASHAEDSRPEVIFLADSEREAARAFDVGALDYMLCPLTEQRIQRSLGRARTLIRLLDESSGADSHDSNTATHLFPNHEADEATPAQQNGRYLKRVVVKSDESIRFIATEDIDWIEACGDRVLLHARDGDHLIRCTMKELERKLDPERFLRIHRSTIINVTRLQELQPYFHGEFVVVLSDGTKLRMSRGRRENLERLLGQAI